METLKKKSFISIKNAAGELLDLDSSADRDSKPAYVVCMLNAQLSKWIKASKNNGEKKKA